MNLKKGISPVIATVIIVAVAVAISIAVVGWIMGLWGSIAGGTEQLQIMPDSYIVNNTAKKEVDVVLHVVNRGSAAAVVYKIEIVGVNETNKITVYQWNTQKQLNAINPGTEANITATVPSSKCTPGAYYLVKVYTKAGNVYQANVICKSG